MMKNIGNMMEVSYVAPLLVDVFCFCVQWLGSTSICYFIRAYDGDTP